MREAGRRERETGCGCWMRDQGSDAGCVWLSACVNLRHVGPREAGIKEKSSQSGLPAASFRHP